MTRVSLTGVLRCASAADAAIVAGHVGAHERLSRAEPGCLAFAVSATCDPLVWAVTEQFTDRAAFEAHQARTRASEWWAATGHIARDFSVTRTE